MVVRQLFCMHYGWCVWRGVLGGFGDWDGSFLLCVRGVCVCVLVLCECMRVVLSAFGCFQVYACAGW